MFETLYPTLFTNLNAYLCFRSQIEHNLLRKAISRTILHVILFIQLLCLPIQAININYLLLNAYYVPWSFHSTIYLCFLVLIIIVILHLSLWLFDCCLFSINWKLRENRTMIIFYFPLSSYMPSWRPVIWPSLNIHWINNESKNIYLEYGGNILG